MDEQTKAKGLMAAGLFILVAIVLVVMLVVVPALRGGDSSSAVAQMPPPGMGGGSGMSPASPGGAMGPGVPGGGGPGPAGPPGGAGGGSSSGPVVEPLEDSRENPFGPAAGQGLISSGLPGRAAFQPHREDFAVGIFDQHDFPAPGPAGETIQVPSAAPSAAPSGPQAPPQVEYLKITGLLTNPQGQAMVILQGTGGEQGKVLQVGDRYDGWRVESITRRQMILTKQEGGEQRRRIIRLQTGGGRGGRTGGGGGAATPGSRGGGGGQPGVRQPGGGFPGVGGNDNAGGGTRRTRPRPQ